MHKTSTPLHKNTETKQGENINTKTSKAVKNNIDIINNVSSPLSTTLDIEKENRLSKVLSLHIMGLSQEEIAIELKVNQSTVSRDLQYIKQESRLRIDKYLREDVPFEYERYFAAYNEISKKLWQTVNDYNTDPKDKIRALSLLNQANDKRHERLIGGPRDYLKIKQSQSGLILQEYVDNNPELKASIDMRNLFSNSFDGTNKKKKAGVSDLQDLNKSYAFMNKN
jgi:ECF sigma factor